MKYKVGDKVKIKSLDWYNENKNKYGNIKCGYMPFTSNMSIYCGAVLTICDINEEFSYYQMEKCEYMFMDYMIECKVEEETKSHNNMCKQLIDEMNPNVEVETETHRGYCTTESETTCEGKKRCVVYFWDSDFADKVELDLSDRELIQEDGKWFVVKKKPKYPKSYEECLKIMNDGITMACLDKCYGYKGSLITKFQELIFYRDAYWKIAGDWKPDWCSGEKKHCIYDYMGKITRCSWCYSNAILAFPTEEMRDAFYENFKKEIEICKELL